MSRPRAVTISVRTVEKAAIVDLEGEVDIGTAPLLRTRLFELLTEAPRLVLNMTGVRYIDSSGIATLVEARVKAQSLKKDVALYGLNDKVLAVLKLTRLIGFFRVVENEEAALQGNPPSHG